MVHLRVYSTLLAACALVWGCKYGGDTSDSDVKLVSQKGSFWKDPTNIPVCFTNSKDFPSVAENIKLLLIKEFNRTNRVRLRGFKECAPKDLAKPEIRIEIRADAWKGGVVGCSHIGPEVKGSNEGCGLGGGANLYVAVIFWRQSIVHEVGHALGFRHEHHRPDRTENCTEYDGAEFDRLGSSQMVLETVFDANSVMSYCGPRKSLLSDLDIQGMNKVYSGPIAPQMALPLLSVPNNKSLFTLEFGTGGVCLAATKRSQYINPSNPGLGKMLVKGAPFETYPCTIGRTVIKFRLHGEGDVKKIGSKLNGFYLVRQGNKVIQSSGEPSEWRFVATPSGHFQVQSTVDGLCLTLNDKKPAVGSCSTPEANILLTEMEVAKQ